MRDDEAEHPDTATGTRPKRWSRRRVLTTIGLVGGGAVVVGGGWYLYGLLRQPIGYALYWRARAREQVPPDAVRLVAFGDSSAQGIGASRPEESVIGRIVTYVRERTGRPVHITNLSVGGARTPDVLEHQVPEADLAAADLVLVSVGSADALRGDPLDSFERDMAALLDELPADRTVFSDVAAVPGGRPYQDIFARLADERGIRRARFERAFQQAARWDIFADDGVHLNSTGYEIWFGAFRPHVDAVLGID